MSWRNTKSHSGSMGLLFRRMEKDATGREEAVVGVKILKMQVLGPLFSLAKYVRHYLMMDYLTYLQSVSLSQSSNTCVISIPKPLPKDTYPEVRIQVQTYTLVGRTLTAH